MIIKTFCHQLINQNLKLKQSSTVRKIGRLCESFWSHGQSRGGSFPELLCQRSEDVLSVTGFIMNELMNLGVRCTHVFSKLHCLGIYAEAVPLLTEHSL